MKDIIGRNDRPCPICGNDKKYKKCCYKIINFAKDRNPIPYLVLSIGYNLLFGNVNENFLTEIEDIPIDDSIKFISWIDNYLYKNPIPDQSFYNRFFSNVEIKKLNLTFKLIPNSILITPYQLVNLFKLILLTSKNNTENKLIEKNIGKLFLDFNDFIEKADVKNVEDFKSYAITNLNLNNDPNDQVKMISIVKAYKLFVELPNQYPDPAKIVDLNSIFELESGLTLLEYISMVFGLFSKYIESIEGNYISCINEEIFFNKTNISVEKQKSLFNLIRLDKNDYRLKLLAECIDINDKNLKYKLITIKNYPLIKLSNGGTYCVSRKLVLNLIFENLYWKLFDYSKKKTDKVEDFTNYFGFLFEKYIQSLFDFITFENKIFNLITKGSKEGSNDNDIDILLFDNKNLLIIEIKSGRLIKKTLESGALSSLNLDLEKTYGRCVSQTKKNIEMLLNNCYEIPVDIKNIENIYSVFLFYLPLPKFGKLSNQFYDDILVKEKFCISNKVKKPIILDSLEFEICLNSIESGEFFIYIDDYINTPEFENYSFTNFLSKNNKNLIPNKNFRNESDLIFNNIKSTLNIY